MGISIEVISEYMERTLKVLRCSPQEGSENQFSVPVLHEGEATFEDNTLYLAEAETLPARPYFGENVGLICIGNPPHAYTPHRCSVIVLDEQTGLLAAFNTAVKIYRLLNDWMINVESCLNFGKVPDIQKALELTYPLVNAPLTVVDADLNALGHVEQEFSDELDTSNAESGWIVPLEFFPRINPDHGASGQISRNPDGFYKKDIVVRETDYTILTLNISSGEKFYGMVGLARPKGRFFSETDSFILKFLSESILSYYKNCVEVTPFSFHPLRTLLREIFDGAAIDEKSFQNAAELAGFQMDSNYVCMVLKLQVNLGQQFPLNYIQNNIINAIRHCVCFSYRQDVVILVDLNRFAGCTRDVYDTVQPLALLSGCAVGAGNTFTHLRDVRYSYEQACAAVRLGFETGQDRQQLFSFSDYALPYILQKCTVDIPAEALRAPGVQALDAIDRETGSEYCKTLRVYFQNNMNLAQSAKELHIHRNTLLYRMEKIKSILPENPDEYKDRLFLMISLEM